MLNVSGAGMGMWRAIVQVGGFIKAPSGKFKIASAVRGPEADPSNITTLDTLGGHCEDPLCN